MALQDAQKKEASWTMFKGSDSSKIGPSEMERITYVLEGVDDQVDWRASMVAYMVVKTKSHSRGRNTFLAKREC
jgi:hypothetical protein